MHAPLPRRLGFDEIRSAAELCTAAAKGNVALIRGYIRAGINVDAADYDKRTALHIAAAEGALDVVRSIAQSKFYARSTVMHHMAAAGVREQLHASMHATPPGSAWGTWEVPQVRVMAE